MTFTNPALLILTMALSWPTTLRGVVTIAANGVKNAASYAGPAFANGMLAQGSLFVVFGSGLGPAQIQYASSFPLPTNLQGTTASVTVNGATVACPIIYTSDGQIAGILPSGAQVGTGSMVVSFNGNSSAAAPIRVAANSPGLFAVNQQGVGSLVVQDASGQPNSSSLPFAPGQTVVFWGTGLGAISGSDASQPEQVNLPGGIQVAVNIGGKDAQVVYAGRSQNAGLDQINVVIPGGLAGCHVPVYLTVTGSGGITTGSNFGTMSIGSSDTVCQDAAYPQAGFGGKGYKNGIIGLMRSVVEPVVSGQKTNFVSDVGGGNFNGYSPSYFDFVSATYVDKINGACTLAQVGGSVSRTPPTLTNLDAGTSLNLTGPTGTRKIPQLAGLSGFFSGGLGVMNTAPGAVSTPLTLEPGTYMIDNGSGGADVGPFQLSLVVPPAFTWTNKAEITAAIDRSQPLTITWSGGDPAGQVYVVATSYADAASVAALTCYARIADGQVTIPPSLLSQLPPSFTFPSGLSGGSLTVSGINGTTGTARGLDVFTASVTTASSNNLIMYK